MDKLRNEILQNMYDYLDSDQLQKLELTLDFYLNEYNITEKSREVATYDHSNDIMVKNFLGTKKMSGLTPRTVEHYAKMIGVMLNDIGKPIPDITTNDLRYHFAKWQIDRGVSGVTLNNMRRIYSSFFTWLENEEYIDKSPMRRIQSFKTPKKQVSPFTEKEMEQLYSACDSLRDLALLHFLYSSGARITECANTDIKDLDLKRGEFIIRKGKGNKERKAYLSEVAMLWISKYLDKRTDDNPALWVGKRGRLTVRGLEAIISKIGEKAGVENAHPHRFRHTLASDMVKRNAPVHLVQQILGHEGIDTTMIYVAFANDEAKNAHRKLID